MRTGKGNQEEEDYGEEEDLGSKREGSSSASRDAKDNDKASAVRSKHSVTEQRRRSKINERFQVLRELIPNSEQKRDTASFLLEVIGYVQYLQEKVQKYEGSYPGWSQEPTKLTPWRNNHWRVQSLASHPVALNNGSAPVLPFPGKFEEITVASAHATVAELQSPVECDKGRAIASKSIDSQAELDDKGLPSLQPIHPFAHSEQVNNIECPATSDGQGPSDDLVIESGTISISTVYSHELLSSLTQALQKAGIDLSHAKLSVQIDLGKRANPSNKKKSELGRYNRPMDFDLNGGSKRVFDRLGGSNRPAAAKGSRQEVCSYWRAGRCNRNPCQFLHRELPGPGYSNKRVADEPGFAGPSHRRGPGFNGNSSNSNTNTWGRFGGNRTVTKTEKVCRYWVDGSCSHGDKCRYLHCWSIGDSFSLLTQLDGHEKLVTGIALPSGSDKLYTGSKDETIRLWDCASGQCTSVLNLGAEVGCVISEGPWLLVGMPNLVKAWNIETNADQSLSGPVGQVYSLVVGTDLLFAGTQDGSILAWRYSAATNCFEPAASLTGHTLGVVTLYVGANRLYSGSMDKSIKVWSLDNLQCIQTLTDHTSVVMSLICWDQFLLSCSLDNTVKIWAAVEGGNLEVTYTHKEEHGVLALCGVHDAEAKPILLCSCNDSALRLYDLPSFTERGKIFAKQEIRSIQIGPGGIFFTGDGTGQVKVWKWSTAPTTAAMS